MLQDAHFSVSVETHSISLEVHAMTSEMKQMMEDARNRTPYVVG
jgi:hypothetical protein